MKIIRQIIDTLNLIDVHGADNLDRLLACIQGLEKLDAVMEATRNDNNNEQGQEVSPPVD